MSRDAESVDGRRSTVDGSGFARTRRRGESFAFLATRPALAAASLLVGLHAGCSCVVDTHPDEEGQPCLNGLCLTGYRCERDVCVSISGPKRDAGGLRPDTGAPPTAGWAPPQQLGHPETGGNPTDELPSVAVSESGDAFLAFSDSNRYVWARRHRASTGTWDSLFQVNDGMTLGNAPRVAVDPNGNAIVAWTTGSRIYSRRYSSTPAAWPSGWQEGRDDVTPSLQLSEAALLFDAHYASNGLAVVLFSHGYPWANSTAALAGSSNGRWLNADLPSASNLGNDPPSMGVETTGGLLAITTVHRDSSSVRASLTAFDGARFATGPDQLISPSDGNPYQDPGFALSGPLDGVAVYRSMGTGGLHATRLSEKSWGAPAPIEVGPGTVPEPPAVSGDATGNALVLFKYCPTDCSIWATGYVSHQPFFMGASQVSATATVSTPRVALDGTGRALLLWLQTSGATRAWASEFNPPDAFSTPRALGDSPFGVESPVLDYRNGLGLAAWVRVNGPDRTIEAALYRSSLNDDD